MSAFPFSRVAIAPADLWLYSRRYASVKADLDKAVVERDALQDALHETRTTLTDVRAQRDGLETDLKEARAAAKQLKKVSSNLSSLYLRARG